MRLPVPVRCRGWYRILFVCCAMSVAAMALVHPTDAGAAAPITVDGSASTHQSSPATSITSAALSTSNAGDLLVAFLASDGPSGAGAQSFSSVTGGGLTWRMRARANTQSGTAEIWEAVAPAALSNVTVTGTRSSGSYIGAINVVAFSGAATTTDGAVGTAGGATGAPTVSLTTTRAGSWVWGVGNDWDNAKARTVGGGQTLFDQYLASVGDTYWVQSQAAPGNATGALVTLNDTAPTTDRWDLAAIEIIPGTPDTQPPSAPGNLTASAPASNEVDLSWTASTDNVGVAGYDIVRNGTRIATTASTTFKDLSVSPSTAYTYKVDAFDAAGNVSAASNTQSVTTPAASVNPPVISGVSASNITPNSATVTWTTDIPSSSQVLYGTTSSYGKTTTLDTAQTTNHSQTITGLSASTTYHFAVQSTGSASNTSTSPDNQFTTQATNVTLPDMQIKVPTNAISIGTSSSTGHRQLQYTHITWDSGTGPFEIDPTYNAKTGTATFTQAIYRSTSPGSWTLDHTVPLAVTGVFSGGNDYQFPLSKFTLNNVNSDGSLGSLVASSPKTDYCITGDVYVGGVPNTPSQTSPPASNCTDPTKPLGWSVGWGDQYDQTDSGQPIDLTGVADGTYILEGTVDPQHILTESSPSNNVTDTLLRISGTTVTVISQTNPGSSPPTVSMASPADGSSVSGVVQLQASASAVAPATVSSVQFLLDGQPLGNPVTTSPYTYNWTVGSTAAGSHTLSARVTDSNGNVATAKAITVTVVASNPCSGSDTTPPTVRITNPTSGQTVSGSTPVAANATDDCGVASVQFFLDGKALGNPVTSSPYAITWDTTGASNGSHTLSAKATDTSGNAGASATVSVTVQNPAPPMTCFVMQADVSVHGKGTVTTPAFHTAMAGETLFAFVASDGPSGPGNQTVRVSGGGLTWTLVKRANGQSGDSEVWQATASSVLSSATVTSTPTGSGYSQDLTVVAYEGVKGVGASVAGSGSSGAPNVKLTTTAATSLVFAVGNDWDTATPRTLPAGWTMLDEWAASSVGDDYWTQYTNTPTGAAGSVITASDTGPTSDRWNMVAVELLNDGG